MDKPNTWRTRIARALAGKFWPEDTKDTTMGVAPEHEMSQWAYDTSSLGTKRFDIYRDMDRMDSTMPEISRALDILADNAINAPDGVKRSFHIRYDEGVFISKGRQKIIEDCVRRTQLESKTYSFMRETVKYGESFIQPVVNSQAHISRLMYMNPFSMYRNEDEHGLLKTGKEQGEWAFEQYEPGTMRFIAGFYPFQMLHLRWGRSGMSRYGRAALESARYPFKKLQAMEEALVINWLTRAFARLMFQIDTTGMSPIEAAARVKEMKAALTSRAVAAQQEGAHRLTTVQDLYVGNGYVNNGGSWQKSLNDVSVLDTSNTGFWNIAAVEYWRTKLVTATGVPKAHLGIEQDVNAKCLALDTRIPLLRGATATLAEIISEYETTGEAPWVLSWDKATGRIVPGKVSWAGVTRRHAEVLDVEMDDGSRVRATPDHRFYDINGKEIEARSLAPGQQLMPLRMYVSRDKNYHGYTKVKDPHGKVTLLHRRVADIMWPGSIVPWMHVHHIDRNKGNNSPDNLAVLTYVEHLAAHNTDRFEALHEYRAENGAWNKGVTKDNLGDERAGHLRQTTYIEKRCENPDCDNWMTLPLTLKNRRFCSRQCAAHVNAGERSVAARRDLTCGYCGKPFTETISRIEDGRGQFCSAECRVAGIRERKRQDKVCPYCGEEFSVFTQRKHKRVFCGTKCANTFRNKQRAGLVPVPNHRVRRIIPLAATQDTGDITVEGWHNFFVSDATTGGVLVHNSTLQWEDERFARTIRRVQMLASELIHSVIDLELLLQDINPIDVPYVIEWPSPSMQDEAERAEVYNQLGMAATNIINNKVMTPDQVREKLFRMTPAQRQQAEAYYARVPIADPISSE